MICVFNTVKNLVGKGENPDYQQGCQGCGNVE